MEAETFRRVHPHEYYRRFLSENVRPDGRSLLDVRETHMDTGFQPTALGSSVVRIGKTTVTCTILAEFATPDETLPEHGFLVPTVHLSPVSSADGRWGTTEDSQALSSFLDTTLKRTNVIDVTQLCVAPGKIVWALYADIVCVDNDGGLEDASLLALMSALRQVRLPVVEVDEDAGTATPSAAKFATLQLRSALVALSFVIFDEDVVLADGTWAERELGGARVTVVMDLDGRLCGLTSYGKAGVTDDILRRCVARTRERMDQLRPQLAPLPQAP